MPWKLYVDSRRRVAGARGDSDSDFAVAMPYPIVVSGKCYLDIVLLSNNFYTIRAGQNDRIFIDELAARTKRVATIAPGQFTVYELKDALMVALNQSKAITGQYAVTYNADKKNRFEISLVNPAATDQYRIWAESYLKSNVSAWSAIVSLTETDTKSANRPCGFLGGLLSGTPAVGFAGDSAPDVQPYKQLFIRSSLAMGANESLGINGETDIVRRIVVGNTPVNSMIHDVHSQPYDCIKINGKPEISQMWFEIIDVDGRVVDTHGLPVSFSILFQDLDE